MSTTATSTTPQVRIARGSVLGAIALGALTLVTILLAGVVPYVVSLGRLTQLVDLFALLILGTTWNLLAGYGGMVSVGQQAFVGVGGYATVKLADSAELPLVASVLAAAVLCALLALPTSFLLFRLAGGYFAIGTWVVAEVFRLVVPQFDSLGRGVGLQLQTFNGVDRVERVATVYWLSLAVAVSAVLGTYLIMRSKIGLGLTAIRDEPVAAANVGVRVDRGRRIIYLVSAAGAGLAGSLFAMNNLRVSPDSSFSVNYTVAMIFIVVIGGIGTIEGPLVGAVIYWLLQNQLSELGTWYMVILGAVAVAVVLTAPQGIWGLVTRGRLQAFPVTYRVKQ